MKIDVKDETKWKAKIGQDDDNIDDDDKYSCFISLHISRFV